MTESFNNKPAWSVRYGAIKAAVWRNVVENGDVGGTFYSVTFSRSYRGADGTWHDAQSFGLDDLLTLAKAADECHSWIAIQIAVEAAEAKANRE